MDGWSGRIMRQPRAEGNPPMRGAHEPRGDIDCRVRNLSKVSVCLEVASHVGIPDDFVLLIGSNKLKQPCHVIWRSEMRMEVKFRAAA